MSDMTNFGFYLALLLLASCTHPSKLVVDSRAKEARSHPAPAEVEAYINALLESIDKGAYDAEDPGLQKRGKEAIELARQAAKSHPRSAPHLLANGGVLLIEMGDKKGAFKAWEDSVALEPNFLGSGNLVAAYGTWNEPVEVAQICAKTVPYLQKRDELFQFVQHCIDHMHSSTETAALHWAPASVASFFYEERQRRQAHDFSVRANAQLCFSGCKERGHQCLATCGANETCRSECVQANHACVDGCEQHANHQL